MSSYNVERYNNELTASCLETDTLLSYGVEEKALSLLLVKKIFYYRCQYMSVIIIMEGNMKLGGGNDAQTDGSILSRQGRHAARSND